MWNVHNQDLAADELQRTLASLKADLALATKAPLSAVVVIAGDWNFAADGDRSFAMADAEACFTSSAPPHKRQHAVPWSSALAGCTDIHANFMTHWSETFCSASRLDRVYVSLPGWALVNAAVSASVIGDTLSPAPRRTAA